MNSGAIGIVTVAPTLNDGERNITNRYELQRGQKDNYYGWSSLKLKKTSQKPNAPIVVVYNTLDTTYTANTNTYFTVDSYGRLM